MNQFDVEYKKLLKNIIDNGVEELNTRTGYYCKALPGLTFQLEPANDFPLLSLRKLPTKIFVAEQMWFLMGENDPAWLNQYTKIWNDFIEEDGKVTSYGHRWRKYFDRDQIKELIEHLKKNPSSRHGVVIAWDQNKDGLTGAPRKNVPCLIAFTINIIGGKVCMHNVVRSNDVYLGMPHDVAGFVFLQMLIAQKLGLPVGTYTHTVSNAHLYSDQYDAVKELIERENIEQKLIKLELPENAFDRAEKGDTTLIDEIVDQIKKQYKPLDSINGIRPH